MLSLLDWLVHTQLSGFKTKKSERRETHMPSEFNLINDKPKSTASKKLPF